MVEIKDLKKSFDKNQVLKGINLSIPANSISAILGPNGSGKTTLIKSVLGMVIPDKGDVFLKGSPIRGSYQYRDQINYLPQIARFPDNLKVMELVDMIKDIRQSDANETPLINLFELQPYLQMNLGKLSGGTRQKVNVVLSLMFDSPLLILDEPSSGLDPGALIRLKNLIFSEKEKGKTILFTTHILSLVEDIAEEIIFLLEGKIYFQGSQEELKHLTGEVQLEHAIAKILASNNKNTPKSESASTGYQKV